MRTVFIVAPRTYSTRNLLRTNFLKTLKSAKEIKIVILSPAFVDQAFVKEFTDENVIVERFWWFNNKWNYEYGALEMLYRAFSKEFLYDPESCETARIKTEVYKQKSSKMFAAVRTITTKTLAKSRSFKTITRKLEMLFFPDQVYDKVFKKYNPAVCIVPFPFDPNVYPIVRRAARNKVPLVYYVMGFDNLTAKGDHPVVADKLIVWNEIMKEEAVKYHNYHPDDVWVTGPIQFDIYFRKYLPSKEEFFRKIGADPNKKLITYCTMSTEVGPADPELVEILNKSIEDGKFIYPCQLVIRPSPKDVREYSTKFKKNIVLEFGRQVKYFPDGWDATPEDMINFACLLKYSDVWIQTASTTAIEASFFDTPVVSIAFDGYKQRPYWASSARCYSYTHYKPVVESGATTIVRSEEELVRAINEYLKNPALNRDGRKKIVKLEFEYVDGKSAERAAKMVLNFLAELEEKRGAK